MEMPCKRRGIEDRRAGGAWLTSALRSPGSPMRAIWPLPSWLPGWLAVSAGRPLPPLAYLPLMVPQIAFLFGWQRFIVAGSASIAALGAGFCRVLSGQRRPELTREQGLSLVAQSIEACLPEAERCGVTLIIENHYKDDFWSYPEFAQKMDVFCDLVARINHPRFGVNYDPSNAYLAGDDPLELLRRVKHRVVTMHASDRSLISGTLEDLRREEGGAEGYARRLRHGEIGKGLNDYDAIFSTLRGAGFDGWVSIEDGVDGMEQLAASVRFVRAKLHRHWPA